MNKKHKVIFFDNCLYKKCNFHCKYCRDNSDLDNNIEESYSQIKKSIGVTRKYVEPAILKSSGYGEITLIQDFLKLIPRDIPFQLITNGFLLNNKTIEAIATNKKFFICLSLDGHTFMMNSCRAENTRIHQRVIKNLNLIADKGIPIEINSVLTKHNTAVYHKFLDYLMPLREKTEITCYPFPVRPFGKRRNNELKLSKRDIEVFKEQVVDRFEKYGALLPPKKYLERLMYFLVTGHKNWPCYTGVLNLGIVPSGDLVDCPCGASNYLGNIFTDPDQAFNNRFNDINKLISNPEKPISPNCANCFNHYEVINLFIDNEISLKELQAIRLFREKKIENHLIASKIELGK